MKIFFASIAALTLVFFSCTSLKPRETVPAAENQAPVPETVPQIPEPEVPEVPKVPELPRGPEYIMGKGTVPAEKLAAFLMKNNPNSDNDFVISLSALYVEEAAAEGVNHDTAFAQMCLETGFLRYGGLVVPEMNNFCGLGAIGPQEPGHAFADPRTGVRAHIQHLQAYAATGPLNQDLVDPRYRYVKRGVSPTIHGLSGTWAADRLYSEKIAAILKRLYEFD
ncbi:MAG: glucosaminidase domain-containing protein, partial [Treponema sp.]|nr:glucosaminidase domain-containing protein [Treponema sp.]